MDTSSISVIVVLYLMNLPFFGHALFEYICDEKHLYKPYLHVYSSRRGPRILDVGPHFHEMGHYMNVYVCINGPAYLYFSKTTDLGGEVYEAAQLKMYAHTCEMYNVQPRAGSASVQEVQLHLRAVLLLGDPVDYRRVSIQKFTAPYFFRKDQLNPYDDKDANYVPMPAHFINATSLIIIGQSECTLTKGSEDTEIKIRPFMFPPSPTPPKVEVGYLCKIGYKDLLEKASKTPKNFIDRAPALALINDEAIRVQKCESNPTYDEDNIKGFYDGAKREIEAVDVEWDNKKTDHENDFNAKVDLVIVPLIAEDKDLRARQADPKTKPKEIRKIEKKLEKLKFRIELEDKKKKLFEQAIDAISDEVTKAEALLKEADPAGPLATKAKSDADNAEKLENELEDMKKQPTVVQSDIDAKKTQFDDAVKTASLSAREYQWIISDLRISVLRLRKMVERVKKRAVYVPSPPNVRPGGGKQDKERLSINPDGTLSLTITATEPDCVQLPLLDQECDKGKPEKGHTCDLFKVTLGIGDPWAPDPPNTSREDGWKKEVLDLIGGIFATACDRIPNVKKLVQLNNRVMGDYLTNQDYFNLKPVLQTDTCTNYKFSRDLTIGAAVPPVASTGYLEEKPFWDTIKTALKECKWSGRRLAFKDIVPAEKRYKFVKDPGTPQETEHDIIRHEEQADQEYSYNWPIDMNWKMFATVLGLCMSGYEKKIPLITSHFFSLYTEYFLIPLRETWINPKDNMVFQFIMGEFYDGDAEFWAEMCMESSFIASGQVDYRPPRTVMVNCASENNYFVNGAFAKAKTKG